MKYRLVGLAGATALCAVAMALPPHPPQPISSISSDNLGEFVAVSGRTKEFYPPPEPRAPYAFLLEDASTATMRVVIWPDIYARVDNHPLLEQQGTSVTLTAEVAEYKDKIELHLQDWEEIRIEPATSATEGLTTAPAIGHP